MDTTKRPRRTVEAYRDELLAQAERIELPAPFTWRAD